MREFLESVAVVKDLKPSTTGCRLDDNSGGQVRYNGEWVDVGRAGNPTLGFKMVKLKPVKRECSLGCGKQVKDQVVETRICEWPQAHWRTKCQACGKYVSPDGQGFVEGGPAIQAAFMKYFRDNNK